MSILGVNLISKVSFNFHPRLLLLPWSNNTIAVRCLNDRASNPSFPVRYIPKRPPNSRDVEDPSFGDNVPDNDVSSLSESARHGYKVLDHNRSTIFSEKHNIKRKKSLGGLPLDAAQDEVVGEVEVHDESGQRQQGKPKAHGIKQDAEKLAVELLAKRAYTTTELRKKLNAEHFPVDIVERVISEFQGRGLINDRLYAETHSLSRCSFSSCGPRRIKQVPQPEKHNIRRKESSSHLPLDAVRESNEDIDYNVGIMESEFMELPDEVVEEVEVHDENGQHQQGKSKACWTEQDAEKLAVELLAKRAYTAVELRKKLNAKRFPIDIVEGLICDFQGRGLINDRLYAETYSRSRWSSSSWGPKRIKQQLLKKGISEVDVRKAVQLVFEDGEDNDQKRSLSLSKSAMHQLYAQVSKQWLRSQNVPHETRKARIIRWLQYRGFDWGVVSDILKKLESKNLP